MQDEYESRYAFENLNRDKIIITSFSNYDMVKEVPNDPNICVYLPFMK